MTRKEDWTLGVTEGEAEEDTLYIRYDSVYWNIFISYFFSM